MVIEFVFRDESRRRDLESLCADVLDHHRPPQQTLCCIFDNEERFEFLNAFGPSYCGFFYPVASYGIGSWPGDLKSHVSALERGVAFTCDVAVYIRKRTCEHKTGATITFAHEIQHVMQHGFQFKYWRANCWLPSVTGSDLMNPKPWDLPTEYDAQLAAKRVAQSVLGVSEVERYTREQIDSGNDPEKWKFFLGLDVSQEYDFASATRKMVERFKGKLDALYRECERHDSEPDFTKDVWWE
jgi:hypothetical protein